MRLHSFFFSCSFNNYSNDLQVMDLKSQMNNITSSSTWTLITTNTPNLRCNPHQLWCLSKAYSRQAQGAESLTFLRSMCAGTVSTLFTWSHWSGLRHTTCALVVVWSVWSISFKSCDLNELAWCLQHSMHLMTMSYTTARTKKHS